MPTDCQWDVRSPAHGMRCGMNGSWLPSFRYSGKRGFDDASGNTIVEFAFVGPVLVLLLMGTLAVGPTLYMQAVLQGVMQKVARASELESGYETAQQADLDTTVHDKVKNLHTRRSKN